MMKPEPQPTTAAPEELSDLPELFRILNGGDDSALDGIYDLMADDLYGLALWRCGSASEAADALQETFVRLAKAARLGKLKSVRDPRAYLLTMARRAAVDQLRRRPEHRSLQSLPDDGRLLEAEAGDPASAVDATLACRKLAELSDVQREAVFLRCFEGLTFQEIGKICSVSTFTAAGRFRLGIQKLRTLLKVSP